MQKLRELQLSFVEAILDEKNAKVAEELNALNSTVENRLAIYRNNTFSNLINTLRAVYPIVEKIVGAVFFKHAAKEFSKKHFSLSGDLNDYGEGFAEFLKEYEPAKDLPYLADTAHMEWALEKAYYAPECAVLSVESLGTIAPDDYENLRFILSPAVSLLYSPYPLKKIWEVHQRDYEGDGHVDLDEGEVHLLITRRNVSSVIEALTKAEFTLLKHLSDDGTFTVAVMETLEVEPNFDLQGFLMKCVIQGDIVDFKLS